MIETSTPVAYFLQQMTTAITVSAFYALLAVSYVLMHGITRRVNLSFGALSVWAGYVLINLALFFILQRPWQLLLPVALGTAYALFDTLVLGSLIERTVIRPLLRVPPLAMLVATLGVSILLEEVMRIENAGKEAWLVPIFNQSIAYAGSENFAATVTPIQLITVALAITFAVLLMLFIDRHPFGRIWRAVSEDLHMAELTGIDANRTLFLTFLLATACAAASGSLLSVAYGSVSFYSGVLTGLKTLFVAVIGGLGSLPGAIFGAFCLGFLETLWSGYIGAEWRDVASFTVLTGALILFPNGLFTGVRAADDRV